MVLDTQIYNSWSCPIAAIANTIEVTAQSELACNSEDTNKVVHSIAVIAVLYLLVYVIHLM